MVIRRLMIGNQAANPTVFREFFALLKELPKFEWFQKITAFDISHDKGQTMNHGQAY